MSTSFSSTPGVLRRGPELAPFPRLHEAGGSRRLPGRHGAVPPLPFDELVSTLRGPSQHAYLGSTCWPGLSGLGVGGELAEEGEDAFGSVDDQVGTGRERVLLVGAGADQEGRQALVTE